MKKVYINITFEELALIIAIIGIFVCLGITIIKSENASEEKECYEYYKKNNYLLDNCKKWSYKYEK